MDLGDFYRLVSLIGLMYKHFEDQNLSLPTLPTQNCLFLALFAR
jgi:hypothetical protein